MSTHSKIDLSTLGWVKTEIDETLSEQSAEGKHLPLGKLRVVPGEFVADRAVVGQRFGPVGGLGLDEVDEDPRPLEGRRDTVSTTMPSRKDLEIKM